MFDDFSRIVDSRKIFDLLESEEIDRRMNHPEIESLVDYAVRLRLCEPVELHKITKGGIIISPIRVTPRGRKYLKWYHQSQRNATA